MSNMGEVKELTIQKGESLDADIAAIELTGVSKSGARFNVLDRDDEPSTHQVSVYSGSEVPIPDESTECEMFLSKGYTVVVEEMGEGE